jgi:hypothetical protein
MTTYSGSGEKSFRKLMRIRNRRKQMDVNISLEMTIKGVRKDVLMLGQADMTDCLKIIITNGLKHEEYDSEIHDIKVESVGGMEK